MLARLVNPHRTRKAHRPGDVTSIRPGVEVDPREVGLTRDGVQSIWTAVERLYATGLHPAITLCLRRNGKVVLDRAVGHTHGNSPRATAKTPIAPARPDSRFTIFSASKAITAIAVHLLDQRNQIHLDDPVCAYVPEFGRNGKEWITIKHVLTHRAGIPTLPGQSADLDLVADWDAVIERLCEAKPVWRPGRRIAYHALTGGWVLGEMVRRVTGRDIQTFLREEITQPASLGFFRYGVEADDVDTVAHNAFTGFAPPFPLSRVIARALGVPFQEACRLSNDPRYLTAVVPSGNLVATADSLCRFYQLLLDGGAANGQTILEPRTLRRAVSEQSYLEIYLTLGIPVRYGMGLMLGRNRFSLYGPSTPKAFGHIGFTNVWGYADPEREIAVALLTSGKPILSPGLARVYGVVREIAQHCPRGVAAAGPTGYGACMPRIRTDRHALREAQSRAMHTEIAKRIARDPAVVEGATERVTRWLEDGSVAESYARAWLRLLSGDRDSLLRALVDPGETATALRQVSPFAGALAPRERWSILERVAAAWPDAADLP